jgi:hypothetical protein
MHKTLDFELGINFQLSPKADTVIPMPITNPIDPLLPSRLQAAYVYLIILTTYSDYFPYNSQNHPAFT